MSLFISSIDTAAFDVKLSVLEPEFKEDLFGTHLETQQDEPGNAYVRVDSVDVKSALESTPESQYRMKILHPKIPGGEGAGFRYKRRNVENFTDITGLNTEFQDNEYNAKIETFPSSAPAKSTVVSQSIPDYNTSTYKKNPPIVGEENVSYLYIDDPLFEPPTEQYPISRHTDLTTPASIVGGGNRSVSIIPEYEHTFTLTYQPTWVGSSTPVATVFRKFTLPTYVDFSSESTLHADMVTKLAASGYALYTTYLPGGVAPAEGTQVATIQPAGFPSPIPVYYFDNGILGFGTDNLFIYREAADQWAVTESGTVPANQFVFASSNPFDVGRIINHLNNDYTVIYGAAKQIRIPTGGYTPEKLAVRIVKSSLVKTPLAVVKSRPGYFYNDGDDRTLTDFYKANNAIYPPVGSKLYFRGTLMDIKEFSDIVTTPSNPMTYGIYGLDEDVFESFSEAVFVIIPTKANTGTYTEIFSESQTLIDENSVIVDNFTTATMSAQYDSGSGLTTTALENGSGGAPTSSLAILVVSVETISANTNDLRQPIMFSSSEFRNGGLRFNTRGTVSNKITISRSELSTELAGYEFGVMFPGSGSVELEFFRRGTTDVYDDIFAYNPNLIYLTEETFGSQVQNYLTRAQMWISNDYLKFDPFNNPNVRALFDAVILVPGQPFSSLPITDPTQTAIYKTLLARPKTYNISPNDPRFVEVYRNFILANYNDPLANDYQFPNGKDRLFSKPGKNYLRYGSNVSRYENNFLTRMIILSGDDGYGTNAAFNTLVDLESVLGTDYTDNDLFYFSTDIQDVRFSSQITEPVEPVLIGQFKRKAADVDLSYRFILEYRTPLTGGWKKITDSDTVDFSSQFSTVSVDNGAEKFYNVRTLVSDQLDFTEATAYTFTTEKDDGITPNPILASDTYVTFFGTNYLIKDAASITNTVLASEVANQLANIKAEGLSEPDLVDAVVVVFPEQNLQNRINYVMDTTTNISLGKYEKTYKLILGFGNVDTKKMYFSDDVFNATGTPEVFFNGTTFSFPNSNITQVADLTLVPVLNNIINEYNATNPNELVSATDDDLLILVLPKYRKEQTRVPSVTLTPKYAKHSIIRVKSTTQDPLILANFAPKVYVPSGSPLAGSQVDTSNIIGILAGAKGTFTAIAVDDIVNPSPSTLTFSSDYILVAGSNYIQGGTWSTDTTNFPVIALIPSATSLNNGIAKVRVVTTSEDPIILSTDLPKAYMNNVNSSGLWVDLSFIPGISQTNTSVPKLLQVQDGTSLNSILTLNTGPFLVDSGATSVDVVITVGSDYLNNLFTIPQDTEFRVPLLKNIRIGVIEIDSSYDVAPSNYVALYHKFGQYPTRLYYDETLFTKSGGNNVSAEFSAWPPLPSQRMIRSVECPTNTNLALVQNFFTNSIFNGTDPTGEKINSPVDLILVIQTSGSSTGGSVSSIQEFPVLYDAKNIFTSVGDLPTNPNLNNSNISSTLRIGLLSSNFVSPITTVSDSTEVTEGRSYENNTYDLYIYTEADDPSAFSYPFVDDNVKVSVTSGIFDVIRHMKTKRSSTTANRDGIIRIKLFPRTPLVIFSDLKWDTACITSVRINNVLYTLTKDVHDRSKFSFAREGKAINTISLSFYTLLTPEQNATKELVIKIETGGSIKDLEINDIFIAPDPPGTGSELFKATIA